MTVDFEFYRRMYSGVRIPADEFLKYSIKSENLLKSMTKKEAWENVCFDMKMCICNIAEILFDKEKIGMTKSENNDGYSVTYSQKAEICATAHMWLANSGLLWRGFND